MAAIGSRCGVCPYFGQERSLWRSGPQIRAQPAPPSAISTTSTCSTTPAQDCHGFEIELDDIHSTDITYTYDWNHYGAPTITEDNSEPGSSQGLRPLRRQVHLGERFSAFTAVPATPPSPTNGHMCTDPSVNFGCEHFGVGHYGTPSAVKIQLAHRRPVRARHPDPRSGRQRRHADLDVLSRPRRGQPVAQVQAVILAPPPPPAPVYEFGDAVWVKSIVTTSHNNKLVELKDLVSDDPDDPNDKNWANGEPDEVEVEWQILQTEFNNPDGGQQRAGRRAWKSCPTATRSSPGATSSTSTLARSTPRPTKRSATTIRRSPIPPTPPYKAECDPHVTILGDYIGAQMAGFNVEAVLGLIDHVRTATSTSRTRPRTVVVGGNTPYVTLGDGGRPAGGLDLDSATGVLSGTPTAAGIFSFTITATDADLAQVSKAYTMTVSGPADLCLDVVCPAPDACHEAGVCDPNTGECSYANAPDGTACSDGRAGRASR